MRIGIDTERARTFLTVITSGSFICAADWLHVSQSTVSTRIHTLEDQLGCTLFAGTTLTSALLRQIKFNNLRKSR